MESYRAEEILNRIREIKLKYKIFGRLLKVHRDHVNGIVYEYHDRPETSLLLIIKAFLEQKEPKPTWRMILEALRNPLIDGHRLAGKLERIYGLPPLGM